MSDSIDDWKLFSDQLVMSIEKIDKSYFKIDVHDQEPIWRERAYCYELYHQLRCRLEKEKFEYILHGEIDKKGYREICKKYQEFFTKDKGCPNPDFVVHHAGGTSNLVVIEVKTYNRKKIDMEKDIKKMEFFLSKMKHTYEHGIFLVFGSDDLKKCFIDQQLIDEYKKDEGLSNLCILWHKKSNEPPEVIFGNFKGRSKVVQ